MKSKQYKFVSMVSLWGALLVTQEVAASPPLRCTPVVFSVTLAPGETTPYQVVGQFCGRGSVQHSTLQILLHGATYSHTYWDFPLDPHQYSYVRYITDAGYATLHVDRIGVGASDRPPADAVTISSNAYVVHQIVQAMRAGRHIPQFGFVQSSRVMLVGHSLGSIIATQEAATYNDVDGVALSGLLHGQGLGAAQIALTYYPAQLDPRFATQNIPLGYITTLPNTRGSDYFYYAPTTDPAVVALDEATKETVTVGEFGDAVAAMQQSPNIHVPVLSVVGDLDTLFCLPPSCSQSGALANEAQYYAQDACLQLTAIPFASHNLNLHRHARLWFFIARRWADRYVGADTRWQPPQSCP